jgi:dUTP pyrophosphatase
VIERGSRIAQMVVAAYARVDWSVSSDLEESARGAGGFGSTGIAGDKAAAAGD